jgi:hypothetical protein
MTYMKLNSDPLFAAHPNDTLSALPDELLLGVVECLDPTSQQAAEDMRWIVLESSKPVIVGIKEWKGPRTEVVDVNAVIEV